MLFARDKLQTGNSEETAQEREAPRQTSGTKHPAKARHVAPAPAARCARAPRQRVLRVGKPWAYAVSSRYWWRKPAPRTEKARCGNAAGVGASVTDTLASCGRRPTTLLLLDSVILLWTFYDTYDTWVTDQ